MTEVQLCENEERNFGEFRRKVRSVEVLSAGPVRLMQTIRFTGRLSVVVQNGQVLKSGYEEGTSGDRTRDLRQCAVNTNFS